MSKIRKSARMEDCALRIPGVCNFDPETTVLCHAPYPNRGGMRNADHWAAYGCSNCHDYVDGRSTGVQKTCSDFWMPAIKETQEKLIKKGLMEV